MTKKRDLFDEVTEGFDALADQQIVHSAASQAVTQSPKESAAAPVASVASVGSVVPMGP